MTKQEREMIATIGSSLGSAAALLQAAAKEPVKATSYLRQWRHSFLKGMFPPVVKDDPAYRRPKVVECKEVKVKAETKPPVKGLSGQ